uniref:Uncharacterized protein n=1 Tax=Ciona savignyi TaxID=51511 RepID=H2ZLY6_CIOSA
MEQFQYQFKQYAKSGYAANDDYIISSKLTPSYSKPGSLAVDLTQNFNEIYAVITGSSVEVKTFVYAPNTEQVKDATTPYSPLYGNPLELEKIDLSNIDPDTQFSEQSLALLSLRKAKKILSRVTYSITNKIENSDFLPLAVLCDGANNNAGLYFVIISTKNTPEGITEAFKTETISSCGPFPKDKWKKGEKGENEAFLSDILLNLPSQLHTFNSGGEAPRGKLAMQIFSRYELFGESDAIIKSIDENLSVSHASVDVFSNEVTEVLQTS